MAKRIRAAAMCSVLLTAGWIALRAQAPAPVAAAGTTAKKAGMIYQPSVGSFWDPSVIYSNGTYYMFTMYGGDGVWLATSGDGVHWKDYGVVLKSEGFKNNRVWKQYIHKVGDRYILNH